MASAQTLETRLVSGTGVIRIPTDKQNLRVYNLVAQLQRPPRSPYMNYKSNPPESYYGRVTALNAGAVHHTFDINFNSQMWQYIPDISGQSLITLKCAEKSNLETFDKLAVALQAAVFVTSNLTGEHTPLGLGFDEFRVVCYAESAIRFTLIGTPYDVCGTSMIAPVPSAEIPVAPVPVAAGTPLDISLPYDDGDVSKKHPLDDLFQPPSTTPKQFSIFSRGLNDNCTPSSITYTNTITAVTVSFETRVVPSGQQFAGCNYDFVIIDGIPKYPDLSYGSAPGTGIITVV